VTGPAGHAASLGGSAPAADLRAALRGVRALVLDADGVLVMRGAALPGAAEALAHLDERRIPWRVATNYSSKHRETLAAHLADIGVRIPPGRLITSLSATVDDVKRRYPGQPVFVLTHPDGLREFGDHPLLEPARADAEDARVAAVILGDAAHDLSYENLDRAFRLVRRGAELVAMHRNGWWHTAKGETIDTGAFVAALEYATGVRARLTGKPAPLMFRAAFRGLAADVAAAGGPPLRRSQVAMVGDHAPQDIVGARRAGLRAILILSGRTTAAEVAGLRGLAVPGAVAANLLDVVAALG
jgi:HAD superfamily hydrolase (TIGR01450 family)